MFGTSMDDPRTAATLQLAQGLLSSPRVMQGLAGGLSGYQQAMAQAKQQKALEDYRALQMQQMQAQMLAQRKQQEQAELDTGLTRKAFTAVKPVEANAASGIMGPRPEALAPVGKLPSFDPAAFIASGGSPEVAFALQKSLTKTGPEYSPTVQYDQDGRAFLVAKDGTHKYIDGVKARDKLVSEDLGGQKVLRTEYSADPRGVLGKTQSPDSKATNALGWANHNLSQQRLQFDRANTGEAKPPQGYRWKPDGTLEPIKGGPADRQATASEGERKAATLLARLEGSESQLREALAEKPDAAKPGVWASMAGATPLVGEALKNKVNSTARQRVEAAQLDILDAALTLGTGAAYTREQLEGYRRSYFPQIGDDDATIADKEQRLSTVINAARISAGRAANSADAAAGVGATPRPAKPRFPSTDLKAIQAEADAIINGGR